MDFKPFPVGLPESIMTEGWVPCGLSTAAAGWPSGSWTGLALYQGANNYMLCTGRKFVLVGRDSATPVHLVCCLKNCDLVGIFLD
jgi:hypothetical protein